MAKGVTEREAKFSRKKEPWPIEYRCKVTDSDGEAVYTDEFTVRGIVYE